MHKGLLLLVRTAPARRGRLCLLAQLREQVLKRKPGDGLQGQLRALILLAAAERYQYHQVHPVVLLPRAQPRPQRQGQVPHPQPAQELLELLKRDEGVRVQREQRVLLVTQGRGHQVPQEQYQNRPRKDLSHPIFYLRFLTGKRCHLLRPQSALHLLHARQIPAQLHQR